MNTSESQAKKEYAEWCDNEPNMPIFLQPWWLDAVCAGKEWDVLLYKHERLQTILAAMPFLINQRWGMRYIIMPQQTQLAGIWFDHTLRNDDGSVWDKPLQSKICATFAFQLQKMHIHYYYQQYTPGNPAPETLKTLGFHISKRVTYRLPKMDDMNHIVENFSKNQRRSLRKAETLQLVQGMNPEDFYRFHCQCMTERNKQISYAREFLLVLERKTARLQQSTILGITNNEGQTLAAAFLVWDHQFLYYLIPTYLTSQRDSGASARLVLEAMKLAKNKKLTFDFEGSMVPSIANFYQQFGTEPVHYYSVRKIYRWYFSFPLLINKLKNQLQYGI